jgi:glutamine amidotransferase
MIAVIDVTGNNLTSLSNALQRLGVNYQLTHCEKVIQQASHVILPGVGTAQAGMKALHDYHLVDVLKALTQPLLGICLGMQLMLEHSEEGDVACLGLMPGRVERLVPRVGYPVPHMGWNQLNWPQPSIWQQGLDPSPFVYFVHSYAVAQGVNTVATCEYTAPFSAIIQHDNRVGMQFHPEKSSAAGLQLLRSFCNSSVSEFFLGL